MITMLHHNSGVRTRMRGDIPDCIPCEETADPKWREKRLWRTWRIGPHTIVHRFVQLTKDYEDGRLNYRDWSANIDALDGRIRG